MVSDRGSEKIHASSGVKDRLFVIDPQRGTAAHAKGPRPHVFILTIKLRHITLIMCRVFDLRLLRRPSQLKPWNHLVRINEMLT
jgi:hypothetical protein